VSPADEARELVAAAHADPERLEHWLARRLDGEPLAWITGSVVFAGARVRVLRGVYVPRPQTEPLVKRAVELLPTGGLAADLCTGSGAVAVALRRARPTARVVATDVDPEACRCAAENDVEIYQGHLGDPIPDALGGSFDVVVAVVPYVPSEALIYLPSDVQRFEPRRALDGGPGGTVLLEQAVWAGHRLLRPGGSLLLELGGDQDDLLTTVLRQAGFDRVRRLADEEGDLRAVEAELRTPQDAAPPHVA